MKSEYKTTLPLKSIDDAKPEAKALLEAAQKKMGFVPNMYGAMANSSGLLNTYIQGYNAFREKSGFSSPNSRRIHSVHYRGRTVPRGMSFRE